MDSHSPHRQIRESLARGAFEETRSRLSALLTSSHAEHVDCREWGELCEEAGLPALAMAEYEAAIAKDASDSRALMLLVDLCIETGDDTRALHVLMKAHRTDPADLAIAGKAASILHRKGLRRRLMQVFDNSVAAGADEEAVASIKRDLQIEDEGTHVLLPGEADLVRFHDLFSGREDVHARQWHDAGGETGYTPVRQPLTIELLRNHILGNVTLGIYPLRLDGTVNFAALDLDINRAFLDAHRSDGAALAEARDSLVAYTETWRRFLIDLAFDPLLEDSGYKGRHLWVLFTEPVPAATAYALVRALLVHGPQPPHQALSAEAFPKQPSRGRDGLGNLIKLPLGIHRRTGRRAALLGADGELLLEPWAALAALRRATPEQAQSVCDRLGPLHPAPKRSPDVREIPRRDRATEGPAPAPSMIAWTEAHFDSDRAVAHLLKSCPILAMLKTKAITEQRLTYEERLVLRHSLGHLPSGVRAVNYLLGVCAEVPADQYLVSPLRGSPISCAKIHQRTAHLTAKVDITCACPETTETYPHPLLFIEDLEPDPGEVAQDSLDGLARTYAALRRRKDVVAEDAQDLEHRLIAALESRPDRSIVLPDGSYCLVDRDGICELRWESSSQDNSPRPEATQSANETPSGLEGPDACPPLS